MRSTIVFVTAIMVTGAVVLGAGVYDGGSGTAGDPYQIRTAVQLDELSQDPNNWDKCFVLTDDIDMDPNVTGIANYTDSLIGIYVDNYTDTDDIPFSGTFDGGGYSISNLIIENESKGYIGFFGYIDGGDVKNLGVENVNINGSRNVGGMVAYNKGTISRCFVSGEILGYDQVGGFVGHNCGTINECFSSGKVTAKYCVGGFVGFNYNRATGQTAIIEDCYSTASVACIETTSGSLGGFVGEGDTINRCYSTGSVTWVDSGSTNYKGGFATNNSFGPFTGCFWDVDTSGMNYGGNRVIGLNTSFMKKMRFFSFAGWDGGVWTIDDGNDYPRLAWEGAVGAPIAEYILDLNGSGTVEEPYEIATAEDLRLLSLNNFLWDKYLRLTADIDLDELYFTQIGNSDQLEEFGRPFTGKFDGDGHVIRNLTITRLVTYAGFFGYLGFDAEVKSLGLENIIISGFYTLGGLAGVNRGTVSQCYVTGEVNGRGSALYTACGGFIGKNAGVVRDCYSRVNVKVSNFDYTGGFVGENYGLEISRCYSAGQVDADSGGGGFHGADNGAISCFWDSTVNPELPDYGYAQGRQTCFMQQPAIYTLNGWGGDVWTLDAGNDYPRLAWEEAEGVAIEDSVGNGSVGNPYEISTAYELVEIGHFLYHLGPYYKCILLTSDIDMDPNVTGIPVFQKALIGGNGSSDYFTGIFDGNGHVISNLVIDPLDSADDRIEMGLFGIVGTYVETGLYSIIKDLGLENISVKGNYITGGLVSRLMNGEIYRCYSTGTVTNINVTVPIYSGGGLVGDNYHGIIRDCYSSCSVIDGGNAGGIAGSNSNGEISNCLSYGDVSGDNASGLVGRDNGGLYSNCYWDSTVNSSLSDCGYDLDAEIYNVDLDSVEGVSTVDMQSVGTFTDAGWDFVGESDNGKLDYWRLCVDGSGYPRFAWEYSKYGDFVCGDGIDADDFGYFEDRYLSDGCGGIFDSRMGIPDSSSGTVDLHLFAKIGECWLRPLHEDCVLAEISGDTVVNGDDLYIFAEQWLCSAPVNWDRADLNSDDVVNETDLDIWIEHWLEGTE